MFEIKQRKKPRFSIIENSDLLFVILLNPILFVILLLKKEKINFKCTRGAYATKLFKYLNGTDHYTELNLSFRILTIDYNNFKKLT